MDRDHQKGGNYADDIRPGKELLLVYLRIHGSIVAGEYKNLVGYAVCMVNPISETGCPVWDLDLG